MSAACPCSFDDGQLIARVSSCPLHGRGTPDWRQTAQSSPNPGDAAENANETPLGCSCSWSPPAFSPDCPIHGKHPSIVDHSHDLARTWHAKPADWLSLDDARCAHDRSETMQRAHSGRRAVDNPSNPVDSRQSSPAGNTRTRIRAARTRVSVTLRAISLGLLVVAEKIEPR